MSRVVVVGSVNLDTVIRCGRLPRPGETVLASSSTDSVGGKGANQASSAARWGRPTVLLACVGDDAAARWAVEDLAAWGVDTRTVRRQPGTPTGRATVMVDDRGENAIVVERGANELLTGRAVAEMLDCVSLTSGDVVLTCHEVSQDCVDAAARGAAAAGAVHVDNASPILDGAPHLNPTTTYVVNEIEAMQLTGESSPMGAVQALAAMGCQAVVTRGAGGAVVVARGANTDIPAEAVEVVDTTGAGDAAAGVLAAELAAGSSLTEAAKWAVRAGSFAVTAAGARGALARRTDL